MCVVFFFSRLVVTGPVTHCLYQLLDTAVSGKSHTSSFKKLLLDRLLFAPPYLLVLLYLVALLEVPLEQTCVMRWGGIIYVNNQSAWDTYLGRRDKIGGINYVNDQFTLTRQVLIKILNCCSICLPILTKHVLNELNILVVTKKLVLPILGVHLKILLVIFFHRVQTITFGKKLQLPQVLTISILCL